MADKTTNKHSGGVNFACKGKTFSLLHINIRSLCNKIGLIELLCQEKDPDFLCISEHWMCRDEAEMYRIQGYVKVCDFCRSECIRGGTVIYAREHLADHCVIVKNVAHSSIELTYECSAIIFKNKLCIICLYRSQKGDLDVFIERLSDTLGDIVGKRRCSHVIICGDLNIDSLTKSASADYLSDIFSSYGLRSLISEPTRVACLANGMMTRSALDYMVTNYSGDEVIMCDNFQPGYSDHHAQLLAWVMDGGSGVSGNSKAEKCEIRKINSVTITEFAKLFTTHDALFTRFMDYVDANMYVGNVDDVFGVFWDHLEWCFLAAFPLVKISKHRHRGFKFSRSLRQRSEALKDLSLLCRTFNSDVLNNLYRSKKSEIKMMIDAEKKSYYAGLIESSDNYSKTTWRIVNPPKEKSNQLKIYHEGRLIEDASQVSELFCEYYSTVVAEKLDQHFQGDMSRDCTTAGRSNPESLFIAPVAADDIRTVVASLPERHSTGFDGIPIRLVRQCSDILAPLLAYMFNLSIFQGKFPNILKTAVIVPVPKKGDLHDITNYRPIALLSVFSKIFEKIMATNVTHFLNRFNLLNRSQHGFRAGHSTETATIGLVQHIYDKLDRNEYVIAMSFDLSRAFDTLHPGFFSEKISRLGLRGRINDWLVSFLENRRIKVRVGDKYSSLYPVDLGTPQGSVLGPLIFLLYVNDLPEHISEGNVFSYADDTTIVVSDSSPDGVCRKVSQVVEEFKHWCERNRLMINIDKTVFMKFRNRLHQTFPTTLNIMGNQIEFSRFLRFLGSGIDCDLTWEQHIEQLAGKLNSAYYAITALKSKLDRGGLMGVYYGIFHSRLTFSIAVWGLSPHAQRLFVLQKRAIRLIFGLKSRQSCRETFRAYKILTMPCIYICRVLTHIHSHRAALVTHASVHDYNTRNNANFCLQQHSHTYYERSPIYSGIQLYNLLPNNLKDIHMLFKFKNKIRKFLTEHAFYSVAEFVGELRGGRA